MSKFFMMVVSVITSSLLASVCFVINAYADYHEESTSSQVVSTMEDETGFECEGSGNCKFYCPLCGSLNEGKGAGGFKRFKGNCQTCDENLTIPKE